MLNTTSDVCAAARLLPVRMRAEVSQNLPNGSLCSRAFRVGASWPDKTADLAVILLGSDAHDAPMILTQRNPHARTNAPAEAAMPGSDKGGAQHGAPRPDLPSR
jgi:hypothetical protein